MFKGLVTIHYISRSTATTVVEPIKSQYSFKLNYCDASHINYVTSEVKHGKMERRGNRWQYGGYISWLYVITLNLNVN